MKRLLKYKLRWLLMLFLVVGSVKGQKQYRVIVDISDASSIYPSGTPTHFNTSICKYDGCYKTYQKPYFNGQTIVYQTVTDFVGYNKGNFNEWVLEEKDFPLKIISDGVYADCYNIGTSSQYCFERCNQTVNDIYPISFFKKGLGYSSHACIGTTKIYSTFLSDISTFDVCKNLIIENTDVSKYEYSLDGINNWTNIDSYTTGSNLNIVPATLKNVGRSYSGNLYLRGKFLSSNQVLYSDILIINIKLCSPQLIDYSGIDTKCSNSNDGSFSMILDNDLASGKKLVASLFFETVPGSGNYSYKDQQTTTTLIDNLNGTYTYNWPTDTQISPGNYKVRYQTFDNTATNPEWNSLEGTERAFTIGSPTAVSFSESHKQVSCNGGNDGEINLTASGGVGNYQYQIGSGAWTAFSSASSTKIAGLAAGSYAIKVRDGNQCVALDSGNPKSITVAIAQPAQGISLSLNAKSNPKAYAGSDGYITVDITGGTPNADKSYTVQWKNSANTIINTTANQVIGASTYRATLNSIGAGSYSLLVTDAAGCTATTNNSLIEPAALSVSISQQEAIACYGEKGSLHANASGGPSGTSYSYQWYLTDGTTDTLLSAQTNINLTNIVAGSYKVEITDDNGIKKRSFLFTLSQPATLSFTNTVAAVNCYGGTDGKINTSVSGGTAPYSYQWLDDTNTTTKDRTSLSSGTYYLKVSDQNGCIKDNYSTGIGISQPTALSITTNSIKNVSVNGGNNGAINITVSGGTAAYTYNWEKNGAATSFSSPNNPTNLAIGEYKLTINDSKFNSTTSNSGCSVTQTFQITEPKVLEVSISENPISCYNAANGTLTANAKGGASGYSYEWLKQISGVYTTIGQNKSVATGLSEGNYKVIVKDSNDNYVEASISISQPNQLTMTYSKQNVYCKGAANGTIAVSVSGGTLPYTYSLTTSAGVEKTSDKKDFDGLSGGNYTVKVTDIRGCTIQENISITEPINSPTITINSAINPLAFSSNDGQINTTVQGGNAPYTYQWTDVNNNVVGTSESISGLGDGTYTLTVKDANYNLSTINSGCKATKTVVLVAPPLLTVSASIENSVSCLGDSDGILKATAGGGVSPYRFNWFQKDKDGNYMALNLTTQTITNRSAATYRVQVIDANNVSQYSTDLTLNEPKKLQIDSLNITNALCFGTATGNIVLNSSGGTQPYTYLWSNGKKTKDNQAIPIGVYSVEVTDAHQCKTSQANIEIQQPAAALGIANSVIHNLSGFETNDGTIEVTPSGGTAPYTYSWIKSGNSTVISTQNATNHLTAGSYQVTITDKNGCEFIQSFSVSQPDKLLLTIEQTAHNLCYNDTNGALHAKAVGGVKPYRYNWYALSNSAISLGNSIDLENIASGSYGLTVTDANNISTSSEITIIQPEDLTVTATVTDVLCFGEKTGSIAVNVSGGTGNYSYIWSNKGTSNTISNLYKGTYTLAVTDANSCKLTKTYTINEPSAALAISNSVITKPLGFGLSNGTITVSVSGGAAGYNYVWYNSSNTILAETSNALTNCKAGKYKLKVTDANNCSLETVFEVEETPAIEINIEETSISCKGEKGVLKATATGGFLALGQSYLYKWFNSADVEVSASAEYTGNAGTYYVIVTDSNGIEMRKNYILTEPTLLTISTDATTNVLCYGEHTGAITLTVIGGTGSYNFSWSNSAVSQNLTSLKAGDYSVTITDENGCWLSKKYTISEPEVYDFTSVSLVRPSGNNADGSIAIKIRGGLAPYSYKWTNENGSIITDLTNVNSTSNTASALPAGTYTIAVTDAIGCILEKTYNLANPGELIATIVLKKPVSCFGGNNAEIEAVTVGGVGGNTYTWYDAKTNTKVGTNAILLSNVSKGSYYLIVNNAEGLSEKSETLVVSEPEPVTVTYTVKNLSCFEKNDGSIVLNGSGGTNSYEYRLKKDTNPFGTWTAFNATTKTELNNLTKGLYQIQVRDTNQCTYNENNTIKTITINVSQPNALTIASKTISEVSGFGLSNGSVTVQINGGTVPYHFAWVNEKGVAQNSNSNLLSNIPFGNYTVSVTDSQQCFISESYVVNQPKLLEVSLSVQNNILCHGDKNGSLRATASGGVPFASAASYLYTWYKQGNPTILGNQKNLDLLETGNYYVIITDKNGNQTQSSIYNLTEPESLTASLSNSYTRCGTENDWTITTKVQGGTIPYKYSWNTGDTSSSIANIKPGNYLVFITDANGCKIMENNKIIAPKTLDVQAAVTPLNCADACNAAIDLTLTGGVAPYAIHWNTGNTTPSITNLCSGNYSVNVSDQKGCQISLDYTIKNPTPLVVNLGGNKTLCNNQVHHLDITIPEAGAQYNWTSNNGFTSNLSKITLKDAGIYTAKVTNSFGCVGTSSIEIFKSNVGINSQFLITSQAFANEEIILINTSNPYSEVVEWIIPRGAEIVKKTTDAIIIRFIQAGAYEITLRTFQGDCYQDYTKPVVVDKARVLADIGDAVTPFIINFSPYPNPSTGEFTVDIKLQEKAAISLRLYSLISRTALDDRQLDGSNTYSLNYKLNLESGVYFILLETAKGNEIRKIIIK